MGIQMQSSRWKTLTATCLLSLVTPIATWVLPAQEVFSKSTPHGAVACESSVCSSIGIELLKRGGNAADALVGTTLCVGVIGMYHSGIGGGGFALVRSSTGEYESIDFREMAPAAAHQDMYEGNVNGSVFGGLAVAVPGELMGLEYLHNKYGILPWIEVVSPAVHVARNGFKVTEDTVRYMKFGTSMAGDNFLLNDPNWAIDFAPNGKLVELGETMTRKRYADTLELISIHGAKYFYEGPIAKAIVKAVQASNGTITLADMKNYKIVSRPPVSISYRGYKMYSTPAPSSGTVALSIFKTIEGYPLPDPSTPHPHPNLSLSTHRLDEALRFAYASRTSLGDPPFVPNLDITAYEATMLSPTTASTIRSKISDSHTHNISYYNPSNFFTPDTHGTSHVVTADASGMSISMTTTINLLFGSILMEPEFGVILNNEMNDFSIPDMSNADGYAPAPANFIRPGKRPLSSITPIIVEHPNNTLYIAIGAAGGSKIITATIQAVWHLLDHGMGIGEALEMPRLHDQLIPDRVTFEEGYDEQVVGDMEEKGHKWVMVRKGMSAVQGLRVLDFEKGIFEAAGEPRQKGSAGLVF